MTVDTIKVLIQIYLNVVAVIKQGFESLSASSEQNFEIFYP